VTAVTRFLGMVALAATLSAPAAARAERPRHVLSVNPLRVAILHVQLDVEVVVGPRLGLFVAPIYFHHATWYPFAHHPDHTADGGGLDLGARWYFGGDAPARWHAGPLLSGYRGRVETRGETSLEGWVFSVGGQAGYTWIRGRWTFSGGLGLSYGFATDEAPDGSPKAAQLPHRGPWVSFRANVGLAF
jgi:hypothetical protein